MDEILHRGVTSMDAAIIRLEHETQIKPLGQDPDHCGKCACATRGHGDLLEYEVRSLGGLIRRHVLCGECGTQLGE